MKAGKFITTNIKEYLSEQKENQIWYHGTNDDFDDFDLSKFGKTDDGWWGIGIYFHSSLETTKAYGKNIKKVKFNTNDILKLPVNYSGVFLFDKLNYLGLDLPIEYKDYSSMEIIKNIGKEKFTKFIKQYYDVMIINYAQGTKEAVVFNLEVINILE